MRTNYAGPLGACDAGKVFDLPNKSAQALVKAGYAESVHPAPKIPAKEEKTESEKDVDKR